MHRKVVIAFILLSLALGATAAADSVTLYSQGIACINETRTMTLTTGENTIDLPVPSGLIPESLAVKFPGQVVSQSFRYTPPDSVLAAAVGKAVEVVAADGSVYQGTLLSVRGGITLRDKTGTINIIREPTRVSFAGNGLSFSPSIELRLNSPAAGKVPIELTYLTTGFNWEMSYVGTLAPDGRTLAITGWAKLENDSGYALSNAMVRLVAGSVNRGNVSAETRATPTALALGSPSPQAAFEYYLYTLPKPVDLPAHRTLLVPYGTFPEIPVEKVYTYAGGSRVMVTLKFRNTKETGLGMPLPAGDVRLFQARPDGKMFIGADTIPHTPVEEEVSITPGNAFDITGTRVRTESVKLSKSTYRDTYMITLRNHKEVAVTVNVLEHPSGNTWKIISAGISYKEGGKFVTVALPYEKVDSHTVKFVAYVPADGESKVTYTIEYSY